ncbi:hypothetical protein COB28_00235 [Candidatus Dependentiae bacterium]|nr:MAG: hypothetical protein COB28_00235 [Candidatus Dependentiae bacterium]
MVFVDTSWNYFLIKTLHLQGRKDSEQKKLIKKLKTFHFFLAKVVRMCTLWDEKVSCIGTTKKIDV